MYFFLLIFFSLCDEISTKICLYSANLPDACKDILSLDISKVSDIDKEIELIKANKMILLFAPKTNYKLKVSTFSRTSVNFTSLGQNGDKYNLDLVIDQFEPTNSIVRFEDCLLHFTSTSNKISIQFDWIEFTRCDITFTNIDNKITAQAAVFDSSYKYFSEIIIEGGHRNPDLTINTTDTLYIELKNYENIINNDIHVKYTNRDYRDIEIIGSLNLSFYCSTGDITKLSTITIKNVETLNIIDSNIEFPDEYYMSCQNVHNIHADETSIPVSLFEGTTITTTPFDFTNIYVSHYVDISGGIEVNVAFHKEPFLADYYDRIGVTVHGSVSSKLISLNSSCIDLEILDLNIEMNKYIGTDPIIHCIGRGGVSSVTASTNYAGIVGFNRPLFNRDFDEFLCDDDLTDFIGVELNYLMLSSNSNNFESLGQPSLTFSENGFIHGFAKDDSVVNIFRTTVNPLVDTVVISSPSSKPLKLCYNKECKGGMKIGKEDLNDLSKRCVVKGMKNVVIESSEKVDLIDFSKLFENLNVSVESDGDDHVQIDSLSFNENLLINCTFKKIKLPSFSLKLINVTFSNCSFISTGSKISTTKQTNVQIDSDFLLNDYLISHFDNNCDIGQITIQIDPIDEIHFNDSGFRFVGSKTEYSLSQTTVKWSTIELKKDLFKSNSLTLFANSNNPSFNLSVQSSKKSDSVFSLKLMDWSKITNKKLIGVDHLSLPIQIVMTEPKYIDPIVLSGKGKVIYSHEYSSSSTICACENTGKIDAFPNCKKSDKIVEFSKLNEELKSSQFNDLTVIVAGSSENDGKHPTIDMESINMKIVNFSAENEIGNLNGFLTISNDKQLNDPQLTETYFYNFKITAKSGTQSNEFVFGELSFFSSSLVGFDKSTVKVNYFTCDTSILNAFNDIYITDNLVITGDFDLFEKTIHFVNDDNSEDLKAFISKSTKVKLGEGKVNIGKICFLIEKSDDFDVVLNINSNIDISFECEENAKLDLIPPIQINRCNNIVFDFTSSSFKWPSELKKGDFLIDFVDLTNATLLLQHENTPIKIESLSGLSKIITKSAKTGILSQIRSSETSPLTLSFEKQTTIRSEIELYELQLSSDILISLRQPDLSLLLTTLSATSYTANIDRLVRTEFYVGFDGFSTLQVKFIENEVKISPTIGVLLNIPDTVRLDSPELTTFCSKNYTLVKINVDLTFDFTLDIIDPKPTLHGLNEEAFSVCQEMDTMSLVFFTKVHPSCVPLILCYNAMSQCEKTISEGELIDLSPIIPAGAKSVEVRVGKDITTGNYLNFDLSVFDGVDAEIRGDMINVVDVRLGKNRIEKLTIDGVNVSETSTAGFKVKKLVIVGALMDTVSGFDEVEVTDYPSWTMKRFDSFDGQMTVTSVSSEILFESDGWTISGEKILSKNFPNLKVVFQPPDKSLSFKKSTLDRVPQLKISADSSVSTFIVSKSWSNAVFTGEKNGLEISNIDDQSKFTVITSSFPFPISPLNESKSADQIVRFNDDIEITEDEITLKKWKLNVDNSKPPSTHMRILKLVDDSVINNTSPIDVDVLSVTDGNFSKVGFVKVSEKLTIIGESAIEGQIEFDQNAEISFLWEIDQTPEIIFTEFPKTVVTVNLTFSGTESIEGRTESYNDFLYQKTFRLANFGPNCRSFNEKLNFVSPCKYFTGDENVLESFCNDGELIVRGKKRIPGGGGDDGREKKKKATIISLSIILPTLAVAAIVVVVVGRRRGWFRKPQLQSELLNPTGEGSYAGVTPNYTENI